MCGEQHVESRYMRRMDGTNESSIHLTVAIGRRSLCGRRRQHYKIEAQRRDVVMSGKTCGYGCRSVVSPEKNLASPNVRGRARI